MRFSYILAILVFVGLLCSPQALAKKAVSVETGVDVGDGLVLDDLPYVPNEVEKMLFITPTPEHPFYEIVFSLGDWEEGSNATVSSVTVNGIDYPAFNVYVEGIAHYQSSWITGESTKAKKVTLAVRTPWHNGEAVTVVVNISAKDAEGKGISPTKTFTGTAPDSGGAPVGWRRYQSLVLHERVGLAREAEPVEFTLAARTENCGDLSRELRLVAIEEDSKVLTPIDCQVFGAQEFPGTPPGTSNDNYLQHPSRSVSVVFIASVPANASRVYVAFYDNPDASTLAPAMTDLVVTGPALGAVVENKYFTATLHDKCGQIASFALKGRDDNPAPLLTNSYSRAVHWNPDSFSDNGKWGHTFSWDPPEQTVVTTRGPIMFRVTNSGRMPEYTPQIRASVSYSFYAGVPYVKVNTVTEVCDPVNISAIRNGEVVLDTHLVTHLIWEEKTGDIHSVRAVHGPNHQDEWADRIDHDIPWLALTNEVEDYGLAAVTEASVAFNPNSGEAMIHRPAFYLYAHHQWGIPLTYFTRAWVYPFSDYQRGPIIPVQPGSTYVSRMAFMPFYLQDGAKRYQDVEDVSQAIRHPLAQRWGR